MIETKAKDGQTVSATTTVYGGDRTTVIPPSGGVIRTTVSDPLDRQSRVHDYTSPPSVSTPANTFTGVFTIAGGNFTTSAYGYDGGGNQATTTDAQGKQWSRTFDLLGRVKAKNDPVAGTSSMTYDGNGNLVETTDSRGKTVSFAYDELNRKVGSYASPVSAQAPANQSAGWVYDNSDNAVAGMTNPIGKLTSSTAFWNGNPYKFQYKGFNVFGNSIEETVTIPAAEGPELAGSYTFQHFYTAITGLPLKDIYPARGGLPAETVLHGYATLFDLPDRIGGLGGYVQGVTYDAYGRAVQQKLGAAPNQAFVTNTYDVHTSRLKEQLVTRQSDPSPTGFVDKQSYEYDLAGNIFRQTSSRFGPVGPKETQCYEYDHLRRLTEAWTGTDNCAVSPTSTNRTMVGSDLPGSAYWTKWDVDAVGNRIKETRHAVGGIGIDTATTYVYDGVGANQAYTLTGTETVGGSAGTTSYRYDRAGNMTTRNAGQGNQTLTWNDAGQLVNVASSTAGNSSFLYDADGHLLLQKDPGTTILYLARQQHQLDTATGIVKGTRYYSLPGGGTCIRTGTGTNYTFAIDDPNGTPSLYLDNTAQTPTWRQYTPYGDARGPSASPPDNHGFLDKPVNAATGLIHVGARNYDPLTGRFVSLDPVFLDQDPQSWNGYSYANSNPITYSDPTGLAPLCGNVSAACGPASGNSGAGPGCLPSSGSASCSSGGGPSGGGPSGGPKGGGGPSGGKAPPAARDLRHPDHRVLPRPGIAHRRRVRHLQKVVREFHTRLAAEEHLPDRARPGMRALRVLPLGGLHDQGALADA